MSWSRYSNVALAVLVLAVAAVAPVAAVSVSAQDAPSSVEVGQSQDVSFTVTDLYTNYDQWTLQGETELEQVTWTVTTYDVGGAQLAQTQYNAQSFNHSIAKSDDVAEVTVRLQGTPPSVANWSYDPAQSITLASFSESQQGGASTIVDTYSARPYTQDSQAAREAISSAADTIDQAESAGAGTGEAEQLLNNAISAYDNGNFENAQDLASQAQNQAESAQQSTQQTNTLLMVGGGVVVLLVIAGIVYWFLQQRESYDKLG